MNRTGATTAELDRPGARIPQCPDGLEERWAEVAGARMRYLTGGHGRPLLLIHGLLGYSFSWRFNLTAFAQYSTVYAMDLLGVGFSERPVLDCSLRANAERLRIFLDQLGMGEFELLGTSHGGAVAMMLAALDPARVHRLMLSAPVNPWSQYGAQLVRIFRTRTAGALLPRLARSRRFREFVLKRQYGDASRIAAGTLEGYLAPFLAPDIFPHLQRILRCWESDREDLRRALPSIAHLPTLLLWGDRDIPVPFASAAALRAQFRNAELVVFHGAGHLPYEEVPDEFNRAVTNFLTR